MKKGLIIILFALFAMSNVKAQSVGFGATMFNGATALEVRGSYSINENISLTPYLDYYMGMPSGTSMMMFGVDGHYSLGDPDALDFYPLAGVGLVKVSVSGVGISGSANGAYFDLGGGATYALSEKLKLFGEAKYYIAGDGAVGFSAGFFYSFN